MTEVYFARILDVLPSRVVVSIPSDRGEPAIVRTFDSTPLNGVIELRNGNVFKITIETNPGTVKTTFEPANKNDYRE